MSKPEKVIEEHQNTAQDEDGISKFDYGKAAEILHVDNVAADAECANGPW